MPAADLVCTEMLPMHAYVHICVCGTYILIVTANHFSKGNLLAKAISGLIGINWIFLKGQIRGIIAPQRVNILGIRSRSTKIPSA